MSASARSSGYARARRLSGNTSARIDKYSRRPRTFALRRTDGCRAVARALAGDQRAVDAAADRLAAQCRALGGLPPAWRAPAVNPTARIRLWHHAAAKPVTPGTDFEVPWARSSDAHWNEWLREAVAEGRQWRERASAVPRARAASMLRSLQDLPESEPEHQQLRPRHHQRRRPAAAAKQTTRRLKPSCATPMTKLDAFGRNPAPAWRSRSRARGRRSSREEEPRRSNRGRRSC